MKASQIGLRKCLLTGTQWLLGPSVTLSASIDASLLPFHFITYYFDYYRPQTKFGAR